MPLNYKTIAMRPITDFKDNIIEHPLIRAALYNLEALVRLTESASSYRNAISKLVKTFPTSILLGPFKERHMRLDKAGITAMVKLLKACAIQMKDSDERLEDEHGDRVKQVPDTEAEQQYLLHIARHLDMQRTATRAEPRNTRVFLEIQQQSKAIAEQIARQYAENPNAAPLNALIALAGYRIVIQALFEDSINMANTYNANRFLHRLAIEQLSTAEALLLSETSGINEVDTARMKQRVRSSFIAHAMHNRCNMLRIILAIPRLKAQVFEKLPRAEGEMPRSALKVAVKEAAGIGYTKTAETLALLFDIPELLEEMQISELLALLRPALREQGASLTPFSVLKSKLKSEQFTTLIRQLLAETACIDGHNSWDRDRQQMRKCLALIQDNKELLYTLLLAPARDRNFLGLSLLVSAFDFADALNVDQLAELLDEIISAIRCKQNNWVRRRSMEMSHPETKKFIDQHLAIFFSSLSTWDKLPWTKCQFASLDALMQRILEHKLVNTATALLNRTDLPQSDMQYLRRVLLYAEDTALIALSLSRENSADYIGTIDTYRCIKALSSSIMKNYPFGKNAARCCDYIKKTLNAISGILKQMPHKGEQSEQISETRREALQHILAMALLFDHWESIDAVVRYWEIMEQIDSDALKAEILKLANHIRYNTDPEPVTLKPFCFVPEALQPSGPYNSQIYKQFLKKHPDLIEFELNIPQG